MLNTISFSRLLMCFMGLVSVPGVAAAGPIDTAIVQSTPATPQDKPDRTSKLGELLDQYRASKGVLESLLLRANAGESRAQFLLGAAYYDRGIPGMSQDYGLAIKWLRAAIDQQNVDAMVALGIIYHQGKAVTRDLVMAEQLYLRAIRSGNFRANFPYAVLKAGETETAGIETLYAVETDAEKERAFRWTAEKARGGDVVAQLNLGVAYAKGIGAKQNLGSAMVWFARAAQQGQETAEKNIKLLLPLLPELTVVASSANLRQGSGSDTKVIGKVAGRSTVYQLDSPSDGWIPVYAPQHHVFGIISSGLVRAKGEAVETSKETALTPWPPRPAREANVTRCNTRCLNGDCYRTYSDGRKVRFQAKQEWNPFDNKFEWDSGGC